MKRSVTYTRNSGYVAGGRRCRKKNSGTPKIMQKEDGSGIKSFDREGALADAKKKRPDPGSCIEGADSTSGNPGGAC
jgi:hypothetical protein